MPVEALSGAHFAINGHSPQQEQKRPTQISDVPQSFTDFLSLLASQIPEAWTDPASAALDGALAINERLRLRLSPLWKNPDVCKGNGSGVVVLPGFFGSEASSKLVVDNLNAINYKTDVVPLRYFLHVEPTEKMPDGVIAHLKRRKEETGGKVHLIAHSKGVHVALITAITKPEEFSHCVDQLFLVAGAVPNRVNTVVGVTYVGTQMVFWGNDFRLGSLVRSREEMRCLDSIRLTTIKVRRDPIMDGYYVGSKEEVFEVGGSHTAAVENNLVFIAQRLARSVPVKQSEMGRLLEFPVTVAA
ncbi:hypothetical protein A3D81_01800 [Candidatus Curtissbacteria bacterium RIFCSPHIGHO2_02_FULL_40_17]|uniref:Uncharacterized protein n=3 Tax=Candidatus Curtissiibacteriota TaxID=1752717 RepID=A0A1F5GG52_9BACT|nr:MAG: hypothetical protein A3D81_01800 [Candidatus Curtissbacteria bacterium RIFCSPHIGHO2_02_FULL_40_17]OGE05758.1 MAG: hypothetical protein A3F45_04100 [Candidatus Curtissbacteria bacterium RIFCSPHIGHO2_12_FULL_41_17]OGE08772.1 MAG: hypothetical protein A3I53_00220 [Candidatus Curtissbacteria bacterium RIFCSPLOWO2_02_FULL_40_13b]